MNVSLKVEETNGMFLKSEAADGEYGGVKFHMYSIVATGSMLLKLRFPDQVGNRWFMLQASQFIPKVIDAITNKRNGAA